MDGIEKNPEGIMIIAATNRPWDIDPALIREGRLGTTLYVPPPSKKEREAAFKYNLSYKKNVSQKINYGRLARATEGYSQGDIKGICNNAAEMSALAEYHYKQKHNIEKTFEITMGKMLIAIKDYLTSSLNWFTDAKKELIGSYQIQIVDKKKHMVWKSAKLEEGEKVQYKQLLADIKKNASSGKGNQNIRRFMRFVALWVA